MNTAIKYTGIAVAGLAVGFGAGYFLSLNRLKKTVTAQLADIEATYEDALARNTKTGAYSTVESTAAALLPAEDGEGLDTETDLEAPDEIESNETPADETEPEFIDEYEREDTETPEPEKEPVDVKKFLEDFNNRTTNDYGGVTFPGQVEDEENMDAEQEPISSVPMFKTVRDPHGPYVISIDEFMEMDADSPFEKVELTYFEGDDTLIDSREQLVSDIDMVVGRKNLDRFGEGTTDADQVYIRNERMEIDLELTRDTRTYTRVVLGVIPEEEIRRSMLKPLRMSKPDED